MQSSKITISKDDVRVRSASSSPAAPTPKYKTDEEMRDAERKHGLIRAEDFARALGITVRRLQQLRAEGALVTQQSEFGQRYHLVKSLFALVKFYMTRQDLASEKERAIRADADYKEKRAALIQIELDKRNGEVHEGRHVRELINGMILDVRAGVLAIPGRIAVDLMRCSSEAEAARVVQLAINDFLRSLSAHKYDPKKFKKLIEEDGDFLADEEEREEQND